MESPLGIFNSEFSSFSRDGELKIAKMVSPHTRDICENDVSDICENTVKMSLWLLFRVRFFAGIVCSSQIVLAFDNVSNEHQISFLYQHILSEHFMLPNSQVI